MIIKDATLEALRTMVKGEYQQQLAALDAADIYKKIATIIQSASKSNTYGWLGKFPQLREWVGERVFKSISESSYVLENKKYEATLTSSSAV